MLEIWMADEADKGHAAATALAGTHAVDRASKDAPLPDASRPHPLKRPVLEG